MLGGYAAGGEGLEAEACEDHAARVIFHCSFGYVVWDSSLAEGIR